MDSIEKVRKLNPQCRLLNHYGPTETTLARCFNRVAPGGEGVLAVGRPILANDPHLGVSLPGVWMQVGLHCRTVSSQCPLDVAGFSFSGVPGVVIGHNADISWGFTNLGPDVTDLFLEQTEGDDRYVRDGETEPMQYLTRTQQPITWALADAYTSCDRWFSTIWPER